MIIGVDGLGWERPPAPAREMRCPCPVLMAAGSYGTLETIAPTKSSVIWTSVATGKTMIKHGIVDWTYVDQHNLEVPYRQSERRAKAFWNILTDEGRCRGRQLVRHLPAESTVSWSRSLSGLTGI